VGREAVPRRLLGLSKITLEVGSIMMAGTQLKLGSNKDSVRIESVGV
jgi:hypothetical protein